MWLHFMFDLSWSPPFFIYSLFHCHLRHCLWFIPSASLPLFFSYTDLFQIWYFPFIVPAYLTISLICLIVLLLILCSHWAPLGPWLTKFSIHVAFYTWGHGFLFIGYLGLVSLHFYHYHPSLRYVPCLETTLRLWDQMSSSTTFAWTGAWDMVDI